MDIGLWLTFVVASSALLLIPGPTILLVISYAMTRGRRVAVSTALGVATGDLIAMSASLLGLGALVLTSATLFGVLKWIGAVYLVWLGVQMLRSAGTVDFSGADAMAEDGEARSVFRKACTVTALNPKSITFFIAFVPQFIRPEAPLLPQFAILIATFVSLAGLNALAYAYLADGLRARIRKPAVLRGMNRGGGVALIGLGALTATLKHN